MTFKEKLLIKFKRNKVVRIRVYQKDHRISEYIDIPKNKQITIESGTYVITQSNFFFEKGIPTYSYAEDDASPIDPSAILKGNGKQSISAPEIKKLVESHLVQKVLDAASDKNENPNILLIAVAAVGIISAIGSYLVYTEAMEIMQLIREMHQYFLGGEST